MLTGSFLISYIIDSIYYFKILFIYIHLNILYVNYLHHLLSVYNTINNVPAVINIEPMADLYVKTS